MANWTTAENSTITLQQGEYAESSLNLLWLYTLACLPLICSGVGTNLLVCYAVGSIGTLRAPLNLAIATLSLVQLLYFVVCVTTTVTLVPQSAQSLLRMRLQVPSELVDVVGSVALLCQLATFALLGATALNRLFAVRFHEIYRQENPWMIARRTIAAAAVATGVAFVLHRLVVLPAEWQESSKNKATQYSFFVLPSNPLGYIGVSDTATLQHAVFYWCASFLPLLCSASVYLYLYRYLLAKGESLVGRPYNAPSARLFRNQVSACRMLGTSLAIFTAGFLPEQAYRAVRFLTASYGEDGLVDAWGVERRGVPSDWRSQGRLGAELALQWMFLAGQSLAPLAYFTIHHDYKQAFEQIIMRRLLSMRRVYRIKPEMRSLSAQALSFRAAALAHASAAASTNNADTGAGSSRQNHGDFFDVMSAPPSQRAAMHMAASANPHGVSSGVVFAPASNSFVRSAALPRRQVSFVLDGEASRAHYQQQRNGNAAIAAVE